MQTIILTNDFPAGATDVRLLFRVFGVNSYASSGTIIVKSLGLRTSTT